MSTVELLQAEIDKLENKNSELFHFLVEVEIELQKYIASEPEPREKLVELYRKAALMMFV